MGDSVGFLADIVWICAAVLQPLDAVRQLLAGVKDDQTWLAVRPQFEELDRKSVV